MATGEVRLIALTKHFDDVQAVAGIDLEIPSGEFFSILGPSGCGKTTTLRLVAGFEQPTSGSIYLDGIDMTGRPPHKRNVNTVFQNYALFPFLNVADNVAFGLRYQKLGKTERIKRVGEALELVRLTGYERRRPGQLSGGQQQRVALARALVLRPSVLLLDEPLGALDAKLRRTLQVELKALQESVGITFLYVTHDQEEALTMSDRLAVMEAGKVAQVGNPVEVYEQPENAYVADFLGVSNLMDGTATPAVNGARCRVRLGDFEFDADQGATGCGGPVKLAIRPERIRIEPYGATGANRIPAMVERLVFLGSSTQVILRLAHGAEIQALFQNLGEPPEYQQGTAVQVLLPAEALRVLPMGSLPLEEDPPLPVPEVPPVQPVGSRAHERTD
jgi:spermidine/putrescine transport system ATP-binding protein